jgi:hypothetical protein
MSTGMAFGWVSEPDGGWTNAAYGRDGRPGLSLRVTADPDDEDEPWTWEVLEVDAYGDEMEVELCYADVIVRRWQETTSEAAVLDGDGRIFVEVAAERQRELAA